MQGAVRSPRYAGQPMCMSARSCPAQFIAQFIAALVLQAFIACDMNAHTAQSSHTQGQSAVRLYCRHGETHCDVTACMTLA